MTMKQAKEILDKNKIKTNNLNKDDILYIAKKLSNK